MNESFAKELGLANDETFDLTRKGSESTKTVGSKTCDVELRLDVFWRRCGKPAIGKVFHGKTYYVCASCAEGNDEFVERF